MMLACPRTPVVCRQATNTYQTRRWLPSAHPYVLPCRRQARAIARSIVQMAGAGMLGY